MSAETFGALGRASESVGVILPAGVEEIDSGWCIAVREDGAYCIDVVKMLFNYRVLLTDRPDGVDGVCRHLTAAAGWCYFGHGQTDDGRPRSMETARTAAILAAIAWDGYGEPPGADKRAF